MVIRKPYHIRSYRLTSPMSRCVALLILPALVIALAMMHSHHASLTVSSGNAPSISSAPVFARIFGNDSAIPNVLTRHDIALYETIFAAQKQADWDSADASIARLGNPVLTGHVLALRYLDAHYNSTPAELVAGLEQYPDQPQANDIYTLAIAKSPSLAGTLKQSRKQTVMKGYGDDNGLAASQDDSSYIHAWNGGLNAWRNNHKSEAARLFSGIVKHSDALPPWMASAASYWAYRSYQAIGNTTQADLYLHIAANEPRSFYGILARRQLRQSLTLDTTPGHLSDSDILEMIGDPAITRTIALAQVGQDELAERELRAAFPKADLPDKFRLLALAHELTLASVQIGMGKQLSHDGQELDFARYPIPNWRPEGGFKVDPALIFALMRQESGFHASAVSHGGALGLMQLMPETASQMQRNTHHQGNASEPVMNMTLGQHYVRSLLNNDSINGNLFYMLAAYNAGPGRLQEWKSSLGKDPLLFVESIPYPQTRHYVMQVMANYWIYSELTGSANYSVYALLHNRWPAYDDYISSVAERDSPSTSAVN
jgi:soluble lytic murein transglycosylase